MKSTTKNNRCVRCQKRVLGRRHGIRITRAIPHVEVEVGGDQKTVTKPTGHIHRTCMTPHENGRAMFNRPVYARRAP